MRRRSTIIFKHELSHTFIRADVWQKFSPESCVLVDQSSSNVKVGVVTVCLSSQLTLPFSQRTDDHDKSGAPPSTTCTRSTPLTPAIPTGSMARVLLSSVSSLPKRKVMAFSSWILCVFRLHLCVSIVLNFRENAGQSRSVSILCQFHFSQCSLVCSDLLRNTQRRIFHFFTVFEHLFSFVWTFTRPVSFLAADAATGT